MSHDTGQVPRVRQDRIAGAVLVVISLALAVEATTFDVAFMTDPVGPKALPFLVAFMLFTSGAGALARPRDDLALPSGGVLARMMAAIAAFLLYAFALPWLGFFVSTTLVATALSLLYRGPLGPSAVAAAILSGGLWLLFAQLLSLPLPVGDLWIR